MSTFAIRYIAVQTIFALGIIAIIVDIIVKYFDMRKSKKRLNYLEEGMKEFHENVLSMIEDLKEKNDAEAEREKKLFQKKERDLSDLIIVPLNQKTIEMLPVLKSHGYTMKLGNDVVSYFCKPINDYLKYIVVAKEDIVSGEKNIIKASHNENSLELPEVSIEELLENLGVSTDTEDPIEKEKQELTEKARKQTPQYTEAYLAKLIIDHIGRGKVKMSEDALGKMLLYRIWRPVRKEIMKQYFGK